MWEASLENAKEPSSAPASSEAFGCRCHVLATATATATATAGVFLVLAPACAALRFGLLLSAMSRLTHIL